MNTQEQHNLYDGLIAALRRVETELSRLEDMRAAALEIGDHELADDIQTTVTAAMRLIGEGRHDD